MRPHVGSFGVQETLLSSFQIVIGEFACVQYAICVVFRLVRRHSQNKLFLTLKKPKQTQQSKLILSTNLTNPIGFESDISYSNNWNVIYRKNKIVYCAKRTYVCLESRKQSFAFIWTQKMKTWIDFRFTAEDDFNCSGIITTINDKPQCSCSCTEITCSEY